MISKIELYIGILNVDILSTLDHGEEKKQLTSPKVKLIGYSNKMRRFAVKFALDVDPRSDPWCNEQTRIVPSFQFFQTGRS